MKKILLYTLAAFALFTTACEEMDDIHKEVDDKITSERDMMAYFGQFEDAPEAYTLLDEDYALSSESGVSNYKNFSKYAEAEDYLPEILNKKFAAESGSEMLVTYNYYQSVYPDEDNAVELDGDDYDAMGQGYGNFGDEDEAERSIPIYLNDKYKYTVMPEGTVKTILYNLYQGNLLRHFSVDADGMVEEVEDGDGAYTLDADDYDLVDCGQYDNFYTLDQALEKIAEFATVSGKGAGVYTGKVYKNYFDKYVVCRLYADGWMKAQSVNPATALVTYKVVEPDYTQSFWKLVPPIKFIESTNTVTSSYQLESADYEMVGNGQYYNFDIREGKGEESIDVRIAKISTILKAKFEVAIGDVYEVTYKVYDGEAKYLTIVLEAVADE